MKITMLSSLPPFKGISKYTASLLSELSSLNEVEALNFKRMYPERLYPGGTKDKSLKPFEEKAVKVRAFITWYNPLTWVWAGFSAHGDLVHVQWWSYVLAPVYLTAVVTAKFLRHKKIIVTVHNVKPHESGFLKNIANSSIYKLGDHFVVHTAANRTALIDAAKINEKRISVIPHGILLPDSPLSGISRRVAKQQLGLPPESKAILFFGIIRPYKGLDTLLSAMPNIITAEPHVVVVIAGKQWESWDKYQHIIDKHDLGSNVRKNLEFIPETAIETYFAAADLAVLPYKHFDSQSGAGSLALPFGRAMVVTDVGGLTELVKDQRAVAKPNNPEDLAGRIMRILSDEQLKSKLEADSSELAEQYDWRSIAEQTSAVYEKVIT